MPVRVMIGKLDGLTGGTDQFGLLVRGPTGTTIIDGTSDMFRIVVTGTVQWTRPDGDPAQSSTVTNTDIATGLTYAPAFIAFVQSGSSNVNPLPHTIFKTDGTLESTIVARTHVNGNQTRIVVTDTANIDLSAGTGSVRYYILEQVGL